MAEHTLKLIIEAIDRAQGTFNAVENRIRGLESTTRATGASLAGTLNGIQSGFNQLGGAASTGLHAITSGLDPLKGTLDTINAGVSSLQANVSRVSATFGGLLAAIPIVAGIGAAAQFMSKSLQDAGKETQNFIALQATWRAQSRGTEKDLGDLVEKVKDISRTSSYASQDVISGMKFLAGFPAVATKDLVPAIQTAIDFAAHQNVGIQEATRIMGFAATGRTAWIEQFYGFKFTEATKASKDFSKILAEMQERVAGQEAAKMQTYAGAVGMLEKSFNRVEKAIGHVLEAAIVPVLKDLVGYFSEFGKSVEKAFESGATEEWGEKLRDVFKRVADYTKGVFDGIRNFAGAGGFDRIFTAVEKIMGVMQTLISLAGSLISWLVMLPKNVLIFIGAALGLTAVVKIVRMIWGQWQALWQTLSAGKARVAEYATSAVSALASERAAVDATTAAYQRRNVAAAAPAGLRPSAVLVGAYAAEAGRGLQTAAARQTAINASGLGYAGRTGLPQTSSIVASEGGSKWSTGGSIGAAAVTGAATYAATGDAGASAQNAVEAGVMTAVLSNLVKLADLAKKAGSAIAGFFGRLASGSGVLATLSGLFVRVGVAIAGLMTPIIGIAAVVGALVGGGFYLWATRWSEAAKIRKDGIDQEQKALKKLQEQGYGLNAEFKPINKKDLEGKTAKEIMDVAKDRQKEMEAQAVRLAELTRGEGSWDKEGKQTNEKVAAQQKIVNKYREQLQMLREMTVEQKAKEKAPETVNLLEDVKAIREKNKLVMELAKSELQEKKTFLQLELTERKAVIAETIGSTILGQQAILRAEQDNSAKRMQLIIGNYEETKRLQEEAYNEERERVEKDLQSGNPDERRKAVKELAKLDRDHAKQEVDTAIQTTQELEKELQKQYELRAQLYKKIATLEQQARDAQSATAQSIRGVNEAAASEYDRLGMKLEDAQAKLREAAEQMPKFPEKAIQLAKEAQGMFAGLAQNIDALEQNIRNSEHLVADALRNIEQNRLIGVAKWRAEMNNLQTDMQRAQQLAGEGRYKEAEAAYKRVIQQAQSLASSAPGVEKASAQKETSGVVSKAGKELLALQKKQLDEAKDLNATATKGVSDAGETINSAIDQQIAAAKANIKALEANTDALKKLIGESKDTESAARAKAGERIKEMGEPQVVPKQGEAPEGSSGRPMSPAEAMREAEKQAKEQAMAGGQKADDVDAAMSRFDTEKVKAPGGARWEDLFDKVDVKANLDNLLDGVDEAVKQVQFVVEETRPTPADKSGVGEMFSEPIKDMKGFGVTLREVAQEFLKAKQIDSKINITVNSDGSVSMYRGGGQYDTFGG